MSVLDTQLDRLQSQLLTSGLQKTNQPLFQIITRLISSLRTLQSEIDGIVLAAVASVPNLSALGFLTFNDETAKLPNSKELLAGTNITFDDTVPNERTINASGGSGIDYVVASDGGIPDAEPLNDGFGNFIYIPYVP